MLPFGVSRSPEHDWPAAAALIVPLLHPFGTVGTPLAAFEPGGPAGDLSRNHSQIIVDDGPAGLVVVYALPADGFDVIVNGEHLVSWRVDPATLRDAALANLAAWSAAAPWADEASGERRILSSDTAEGLDAARILLPEVRSHLAAELDAAGRVLVGLPERHLLLAGTLRDDDPDFVELFAAFLRGQAEDADEPIDPRIFELIDGLLVALPVEP